jgi:protein TonB
MLTFVRWIGAAIVIAAIHAGAAWIILHWQSSHAEPSGAAPAIMIDLAPLPIAPAAPEQEVAPGPQVTEAQPEPAPEPPAEEPAPATPEPPPPVEDEFPEIPLPPEAEVRLPEPPVIDKDAATLTPPPPRRPTPQVREPPQRRRTIERQRPVTPDRPRQTQTTAPPRVDAQRDARMAAPSAGGGTSSAVSPASWRGSLVAHLNRHKRFPPGASGTGTATVSFTINRSGQVLSARLVRSSGDPVLDREAVALLNRASPVPAPPAGLGGGSISLSVPVRFNR